MPVLKKRIVKEDYISSSTTKNINVFLNQDSASTITYIESKVTDSFYGTIVDLLLQSGLSFTYNPDNYSITVFDFTIYVVCRIDIPLKDDYKSSVHPWVFYQGQNSTNYALTPRDDTFASVAATSAGAMLYGKPESLIHFSLLQYQINLYYNDNYVCITYNSAIYANKEIPLLTVILCKDHANKEYIYLTNSICDIGRQIPQCLDTTGLNHVQVPYSRNIYKVLLDKNNPYRNLVGNIPRNNTANYITVFSPRRFFPDEYTNNALIFPFNLCGGAIMADNIAVENKEYTNFVEGQFYKIGNDKYYCVSGYNNGPIIALLKI